MSERIKKTDDVVKINFGKLKSCMAEKGVTMKYLADLIEKSHSYLGDIERKNGVLLRSDEKLLALAVGLKPGDLILAKPKMAMTDDSEIMERLGILESKIDALKEVMPAVNEEFEEILYKIDAVYECCLNRAYLEEPEIKKAGEFLMNLLNGRAQGVGIGEIWEQARKRNIAPASLEKARKGLPICQRTVGTGSAQKTRWYIDR